MSVPTSPGRERRYRTQGLPERDALVLKSVVNLLAGKTQDRWMAVVDGPVDLIIVRLDDEPPEAPEAPVLRLTLPIRAEDLWGQLDRVSAQLEMERDTFRPSKPESRRAGKGRAGGGRRLQLMRWPPDELLKSDLRYLRLATMLGARPFTVEELARRSSLPLAACHAFAAVLHANGIAQWLIDPDHPDDASPDSAHAGLLGRIRSRLGLD